MNNDIIQRVDNNSIVTSNVSPTKLQRWQGNRRHRFRNLPQLRHGPHQPQLERHRGGAGAGGPQVEDRRDGGGHHPLAGAGRQGLEFLNFDLDTFGTLLNKIYYFKKAPYIWLKNHLWLSVAHGDNLQTSITISNLM